MKLKRIVCPYCGNKVLNYEKHLSKCDFHKYEETTGTDWQISADCAGWLA